MKKSLPTFHGIILLVLFLTACTPATPISTPTEASPSTLTPSPTPTLAPSPTSIVDAQQYLSDALDIIQKHALHSKKVDWEKTRAAALLSENGAKFPAQTYDTIRDVLLQLGDQHSALMTPDLVNQMNNSTTENYSRPQSKLLHNRIGFIAVFDFNAQAEDQVNKYANQIQSMIIELDKKAVCGWIIDLQEDLGGNMYPMIAGLGALIGEGKLGSFKDANGQITSWYYQDGQAMGGNTPLAKVSHPELLFNPDETPVAVLIGPQTASAGEATAISFRGRPNTRFFGTASYGLTTGNEGFPLSDGAIILLTTVVELDRTGQEYGGKILPDVVTSNPESDASDWLLAQPACKE